jgi:hypothetical protein
LTWHCSRLGTQKKKEQANKQIKNGKISEGVREVG